MKIDRNYKGGRIMKKAKQIGGVLLVLMLVCGFSVWVSAGDLEPYGAPAPTMHSLEDIYNLTANIGTAPVEKTGQTDSYSTGDDGDHEAGISWPEPRFTDNGDGTVTDNLTGLIWLKDANRFGQRTWTDALVDCNTLADDGLDLTDGSLAGDWRLSNVKELLSLLDFSNYNPALPSGHPFSNVQSSDYYWSGTTLAYYTNNAFVVSMYSGGVDSSDRASSHYVWPVRGGN
jgi:hypothetical protein